MIRFTQLAERRSWRPLVFVALATAALAACQQTPLGQTGFDNANTTSNPDETTLDSSNVGSVVPKFDTDLSSYGSVAAAGEPVFAANGNIIVTTDSTVVSVKPDGSVAWHVSIPDDHPEIAAPHILSVYGDASTVDVSVDSKVQGPAPDYTGGRIVKLDNASGAQASSQNTFRPAAPVGYTNNGLILTGQVVDHAVYGSGRTVTIDVSGSGRRIIRNAVGAVSKPAVVGNQVAISVGDTVYQWSTPCAAGTVCDESAATQTAVPYATRPLIVNSTVYVSGIGTLYAIGSDGTTLWTGSFSGNPPASAAASVAAGRVFVGGSVGILFGFPLDGCGASTCSYTTVISLVDQISIQPSLANGLAYQMAGQTLHVVRTDCTLVENCSPRKSITLNGPILGSTHQILVENGHFYVLTNDGHLRAYGL